MTGQEGGHEVQAHSKSLPCGTLAGALRSMSSMQAEYGS